MTSLLQFVHVTAMLKCTPALFTCDNPTSKQNPHCLTASQTFLTVFSSWLTLYFWHHRLKMKRLVLVQIRFSLEKIEFFNQQHTFYKKLKPVFGDFLVFQCFPFLFIKQPKAKVKWKRWGSYVIQKFADKSFFDVFQFIMERELLREVQKAMDSYYS